MPKFNQSIVFFSFLWYGQTLYWYEWCISSPTTGFRLVIRQLCIFRISLDTFCLLDSRLLNKPHTHVNICIMFIFLMLFKLFYISPNFLCSCLVVDLGATGWLLLLLLQLLSLPWILKIITLPIVNYKSLKH